MINAALLGSKHTNPADMKQHLCVNCQDTEMSLQEAQCLNVATWFEKEVTKVWMPVRGQEKSRV